MQETERPLPYGLPVTVAHGLRRILAPNPSPMTGNGTNSYLLGTQDIALIDPGPDDEAHLQAILSAIGPRARISHIVVTHAHRDHSALARRMAAATGAPVLAFGDAVAGRSAIMEDLARRDKRAGGEGSDTTFRPDRAVSDGETIETSEWTLNVLHTPGHFGNHICLRWGDHLFSGDHVMGWSTSVVAPPDGDMAAYMTSLDKIEAQKASILWPGHGDPVSAPAFRISELRLHRRARAVAILGELRKGTSTARDIARRIYVDTPKSLLGAASYNVFAHLIEMMQLNLAQPQGVLSIDVPFAAV